MNVVLARLAILSVNSLAAVRLNAIFNFKLRTSETVSSLRT